MAREIEAAPILTRSRTCHLPRRRPPGSKRTGKFSKSNWSGKTGFDLAMSYQAQNDVSSGARKSSPSATGTNPSVRNRGMQATDPVKTDRMYFATHGLKNLSANGSETPGPMACFPTPWRRRRNNRTRPHRLQSGPPPLRPSPTTTPPPRCPVRPPQPQRPKWKPRRSRISRKQSLPPPRRQRQSRPRQPSAIIPFAFRLRPVAGSTPIATCNSGQPNSVAWERYS